MRFLARLRGAGIVQVLKFSFTYQLDNFREMPEFIAFASSMNCDFPMFERLQNFCAFSDEEYHHKAVHHTGHPCYGEFIDIIKDPIFCSEKVWHDFEYPGVTNLSHRDAQKRFKEVKNLRTVRPPD
jgi:hypothetical protein